MSTNKILLKFAKKGINLSPEAYDKVINAENPLDFASSLIVKLKGDKFSSKDLVSVSGQTIDEITGNVRKTDNTNQKTLINDTKTENIKPLEVEKPKKIKPTPKPEINTSETEKPKKEEPISIEDLKKNSDKPEKHVNQEIIEASETVKDENVYAIIKNDLKYMTPEQSTEYIKMLLEMLY